MLYHCGFAGICMELSDQPVKLALRESGQTQAAHASYLCLYERSNLCFLL